MSAENSRKPRSSTSSTAPASINPKEQPPKSNRRALEEEAGDVLALIALLVEAGVLRDKKLQARLDTKLETYQRKYA
ncbi:hypothetical protein [Ralstonia pseudosolanacearum]|uniref:hypothetical protein n=1 Tax=Ralstonia pseudosolanacearum TaxID=1310165 RepID=UPI000ABB2392|nr:hypothetical protein [Ralstonia pseudosolanacearum]MDO3559434.1 hypothetical protein [Ralstonia pseudosolanacearum]MDO3579080.1 hypothetical protein [Ralstonia pseudosolanacearum]MDO3588753.1 hypothetical protein [Ralstonia pseudosolanacearum]